VLSDVWDRRPFAFKEVDIIKPEFRAWRDLYEFDVPVVSYLRNERQYLRTRYLSAIFCTCFTQL
jgi:hypothetical protein